MVYIYTYSLCCWKKGRKKKESEIRNTANLDGNRQGEAWIEMQTLAFDEMGLSVQRVVQQSVMVYVPRAALELERRFSQCSTLKG